MATKEPTLPDGLKGKPKWKESYFPVTPQSRLCKSRTIDEPWTCQLCGSVVPPGVIGCNCQEKAK